MFHEMKERAGGKPECPQTGLYDDSRDLGAFWLNFCLQETLLPGKPWHKVLERLEAALAAEMKHQLKDSTRREIVFHLLGQSFVRRYFGCCPGASDLLSSKDTSEINKLEEDAKTWLQDQCFKAAERVHHHFSLDAKGSKRAPEMVRFLNDVYNIVVAETELLLATCEVQHKEKKPQECEADFRVFHRSMGRNPQQSSMAFKRPKSIESKDIHLALLKRTSSQANGEGSQVNGEGTRNVFTRLNMLVLRPAYLGAHLYISSSGLSCPESDLLGDLLGAIIARVPGKLSTVCERLVGKLLPRSLRQLIWMSKLLGAGSESCKAKTLAYLEREARVSFGRTVARQVAQLKLRTATRSPVSGLIENAVVEKYGKIPCLSPFATDERMILETSKTLNVLYVFSGTYEPYLIHWLVPLQVAFQQTVPTDEHPYELAMYLHSLHQNLFPSWSKVQATADSVMSFLEREDSTFFSHLRSSFGKNITTDDKDFLVDLILWEQVSTQPMPTVAKELLANPVFFLRKWLAEGFVGVLNLPAVLLVWDQLFMQDWNINAMQSFCASILLLLKDAFMAADDYPAIREVFLMYPSRLLTADIQKAWVHLKQGGLPDDVPGFNSLSQRRLPGEYLNYQDQQFNAN